MTMSGQHQGGWGLKVIQNALREEKDFAPTSSLTTCPQLLNL